jgi:hypothetical protein
MQKLFTEFEVPKKVIYTVSVRPDVDECKCAVKNCKTNADNVEYADDNPFYEEIDVYQCDCCGQWFCISHIKEEDDLCDACAELPPGIRAQIEAFREEVNR